MNKERLQQMVTMLRRLPPEQFNLSVWHCGTAACAVGHACSDPVFVSQGLSLKHGYDVPAYEGELSWDAVQKFFDLPEGQASHLFYDEEYPDAEKTTADQVADRIEEFLAEA